MSLRPLLFTHVGVRMFGGAAILIGLVWLGFWFTGSAPRWSAAGVNTVKTNMALCQVLAGAALLLLAPPNCTRLRQRLAVMSAALVFVMGALTLSEHLFGYELRIDQLLAMEPAGATATASPNRMGPPGSTSVTLLGLGLLALAFQRPRLAAWFGVGVCAINLIPAVGFLYGIEAFYKVPRLTGIAWSSVVALFCLGAGLILARPSEGPAAQLLREDPGGVLLRRLVPVVILIPLALGLLRVQAQAGGFVDTATGTGSLMIVIILGFLFVLWRTAAALSKTAEAKARVEREVRNVALFPQENPFPVMRVAEDGKLLYANRSATRLLEAWQCTLGESVPDFVKEVMRKAREKGARQELELRVAQRDFYFSAVPVEGRDYINLYGTDVTERKRAEQGVERLKTLLDHNPSLVFLKDEAGRYVYLNESYRKHFALTQDWQGKTDFDFWAKESAELFRASDAEVLHQGKTMQFLEDSKDGQGRRYCWLCYKFPFVDADGGKYLGGIGLDVTDRIKAEEALRESEEQFRSITDSTPVIMWMTDPAGAIEFVNQAYRDFFGVTLEQVAGPGRWHPLVHPEDVEKYVGAYAEALKNRAPFLAETRVRRADGQWRWIQSYGAPRFNQQGEFLGMTGSSPDVTERNEFRAELERLVAERTAKLQELVGELEHFSYTITHDLKAPLRAMRGFAEVASELSGNGDPRPFLVKISSAAERMDTLIRDALDYSQAVRREMPLEDVDTGQLLRGILDSYPQFQPVKAHISIEGPLPIVLGNEAGLTQCFSNLLGNAIKFVKRGETPEVRVWAEEQADRSWVRLCFEDKGIGISPALLPRLFDMFSRGSKEFEGTGIGLALVRKVAQRMGGRVGVESVEGKGSRFWIELKLAQAKPVTAFTKPESPERGGGTVLYVEDEENDALFMERAFATTGVRAVLRVVMDGRMAIDYLSGAGIYADRNRYPIPSVVLLDLNLPTISGFEVLEWMRNHPVYTRTPVVVFSSSSLEEDRLKARQLGANDFVSKPSSGLGFARILDQLKGEWLF